jgi:hypothetical protein
MTNSWNATAVNATLHCLAGCAVGEILGLVIGTAVGLSDFQTIALAVALAFLFGYTLSLWPLVQGGLGWKPALRIALAADTLSIATMELVDNVAMYVIPGAMEAPLYNPLFWASMSLALALAFAAALPVNNYLIARGKGHALAHAHHGEDHTNL